MKDLSEPFIFFPFDDTKAAPIYLYPTHQNEHAIEFLQNTEEKSEYWVNSAFMFMDSTTKENYEENFKIFQKEIKSGKCLKAILSTVVKKEIPQGFNCGEYILKLRATYPQAFIYLFSSPIAGTWIGATPETLLKWESGIASTMSLAGTKKSSKEDSQFGTKEEEEQRIVTDYVCRIFEKRFSDVRVDATAKLKYGNMEHLITQVEASTESHFSKSDLLVLANDLHPTPAVGGFPKNEAIELIHKTENHSRLYYSGYLGPIHLDSAHLAVNLRCMSLGRDHVYAFAGGGITADSMVDSEWEETRLKAQALLKFL